MCEKNFFPEFPIKDHNCRFLGSSSEAKCNSVGANALLREGKAERVCPSVDTIADENSQMRPHDTASRYFKPAARLRPRLNRSCCGLSKEEASRPYCGIYSFQEHRILCLLFGSWRRRSCGTQLSTSTVISHSDEGDCPTPTKEWRVQQCPESHCLRFCSVTTLSSPQLPAAPELVSRNFACAGFCLGELKQC
jgi:hypothetical protein